MGSQPVVGRQYGYAGDEVNSSGVSWAAVIAGAAVAAALSLILLTLGTGLGLSSVSPWSNAGASASTVRAAAIIWLIIMSIISSALGGYLAGRLRTKWPTIHTDEVYFRDTAHGFLVWAVSLVVTAAFLSSAAMSMLNGPGHPGMHAGPMPENAPESHGYYLDMLLRSDHPEANNNGGPIRAEAGTVFAHELMRNESSSPGQANLGQSNSDQAYLAQLVAAGTGMSPADSQKRVSDVLDQARQDADAARKAAAHLSLWLFVALLCGAFFASYAATIGGRQRDHVKTI